MPARSDNTQPPELIQWLATLVGENQQPPSPDDESARQARSILRSIVDNLPIRLLIKDAHGRRVFANRSYLEDHETDLQQVLGKTDFDLFPPDLARKYAADDAEILRTGSVRRDVEQHQTPAGRRWIERIKSPLRDADGRIVGIQVLYWDVTDRTEAEGELDRERCLLHSLMDNIPDSIYFKDAQSQFVRISRAQAEKFGLASPEEALGKTDADIFTSEHAEQALRDEREIMATGKAIVARVEKETWPDRADTWVSTTKMPLKDNAGQIVGTFGISRDITELKRTQDELRMARDAADAASRAKSDFLANMSHEIRTPMNAIIGMTELLLDTALTCTQREYLRMVQESGESLLGLLNDILDFSKIEAGRMTLECVPFDARDALGDTLKSLALRAHNKGLELAFAIDSNVPFVLVGDVGRLRQVVINLVGNAIKFTEAGEVVLNVCCDSQTESQAVLRVSVRDTGVGIPRDRQERIFVAFEQADASTTRTYGGTGLGLAIASRLVGLMGGTIGVESEPGRGSTFFFTARFGILDVAPNVRREVVVCDTPVLIVDDNATNRRILFDMLTNWGMKPALAAGAREAFDQLHNAARRSAPFRIVLLDVNMPQVDGFELAAWIRDDPALKDTPLVMLTSASRPGDSERRASLRIAAHLLKPVKQSELFDAIVSALGVTASETEEPQHAAPPLRRFEGLRVLLAEDNAVNQKLAVGVLTKLGCTVAVAANGRQAVADSAAREFDVVLMDVQMPEMDGFDATRAIRQREQAAGKHTPIIAMTAHAMSGDRQRCLEAGMDDYLAKPVRVRELSGKLAEVLERVGNGRSTVAATSGDEPVHWSGALEAAGGDSELLRMVIEAFLGESEDLMQQIRSGVQQGDWELLHRAAHTLKGALLSVGAHRASGLAFQLERIGMSGNPAGAGPALTDLERAVGELLPVLRSGPPAAARQSDRCAEQSAAGRLEKPR